MSDAPLRLLSDKPSTDPAEDRLGYASFARNLAVSITKMVPRDGLVMAVYAPWGSGKTTLLNFIEFYIEQASEQEPEEQPVIVRFNPWWFSGDENLARHFFDQLQAVLDSKEARFGKDVRERLAGFSSAVAEFPLTKLISDLSPLLGAKLPAEQFAKGMANLLKAQPKDVVSLKEALSEALHKQSKKILVIIDDIDRLTAEEVRQLFRVVKAVADFPNIVYLLAFDKRVAVSALSSTQGMKGEQYLEKIVQVPFELPLPERASLRQMLLEGLDRALASGTDVKSTDVTFDQENWAKLYLNGIDPFIKTPRDVVRLVNSLSVTYPAVVGEVDPAEFVAIEALRIFQPEVYDIVRRNEGMFAGHTDIGRYTAGKKQLTEFHEAWLKEIAEPSREAVKELLSELFPRFEFVWRNVGYGGEWDGKWRQALRICSPSIFPVFFRLAVSQGEISHRTMQSILALTENVEGFRAALEAASQERRQDGTTQARQILERLQDYTKETIPAANIHPILHALADSGDALVTTDTTRLGFFDLGIDVLIGRLFFQLLRRLPEPDRFDLLSDIFSEGTAVGTIVHEVAVFGQQHGKYGSPEERFLSLEHLKKLEDIAVQQIRRAAADGRLIDARQLVGLLYRWQEWTNEDEPRAWATEQAQTDTGLALFLERALTFTYSQGMNDVTLRKQPRLDPKVIEPFLDVSAIMSRVCSIASSAQFSKDQRTAAAQLAKEYDMRETGQDPDNE